MNSIYTSMALRNLLALFFVFIKRDFFLSGVFYFSATDQLTSIFCMDSFQVSQKEYIVSKAVVSEQSKTYSILEEDHTLGNSLRHVLMQNPNTEFCGYTVPHPSEPILHMRLQTKESTTSDETMVAGAKTLKSMCDHILTEYNAALER